MPVASRTQKNRMKQLGESGVQLVGDVLREESLKLFEAWSPGKTRPGT